MEYHNIDKLLVKMKTETNSFEQTLLGINLANKVLGLLGIEKNRLIYGEDALNEAFPNRKFKHQKMEMWFYKHPYIQSARTALTLFKSEEPFLEANFFRMNNFSNKARISASTQIGINWEDGDLSRISQYSVGIDFFLNYKGDSLLVVLTSNGKLRVLELNDRLTNTQKEIFDSIKEIINKVESQKELHTQLWDEFALQTVNKKFFEGIAQLFDELVDHIEKNKPEKITEKEVMENSKLFVTRLIGRLLFLWFLKKKSIICVQQDYFNQNELTAIEYYETKLKVLFFKILNTPISKRTTPDLVTPYLNGGLFEPHQNDWIDQELSFPEFWFTEIYYHFNKFNFTTDESSSDYEQIAIDPEMLGRVFENLLATIVPETSKVANEKKNKGTFYTPREIVDYMTRESLKSYLKQIHNIEKDYSGIDELIDMTDSECLEKKSTGNLDLWGSNRNKSVTLSLIKGLNELKVLDPACGSGAFPISLLQLILKTYDRLGAVYDSVLNVIRPGKQNENNDLYNTKLLVIQNNLFGVDIEPMAVEISKLRCWLTLIVDDEGKIDPLPNLDFKFICANTLIPLEDDIQINLFDGYDGGYEENLKKLKEKYFTVHDIEAKIKLRTEFNQIYNNSNKKTVEDIRTAQLKSWLPFEASQPANFFDPQTMFNLKTFDLIIGNPPYIHFENMDAKLRNFYKSLDYKTYAARGDIYSLFYEVSLKFLREDGVLCFITSNKWMRANYGLNLRNYLVEHAQPKLLIDLGSNIFEAAAVDTNILLLHKSNLAMKKFKAIDMTRVKLNKSIDAIIEDDFSDVNYKFNEHWIILNNIEKSILQKIEKNGIRLKNQKNIKINSGIKTGFNTAFIISEKQKKEIIKNCETAEEKLKTKKIIKPLIKGRNITKNNIDWKNTYLIFSYNGAAPTIIKEYKSLYNYLAQYKSQLKNRGQCRYLANGKTNLPNSPSYPGYLGMHHWLELDNNPDVSLQELYMKPKIFWPDIATSSSFVYTEEEFFIDNTGYVMTGAPIWLVDYLNSSIINWYYPFISATLGNKGRRYIKQYIENIPIPKSFCLKKPYEGFNFTEEEINYIENAEFY